MSSFRSISNLFVIGVRDLKQPEEALRLVREFPVSGIALFNAPHDSADYIWKDHKEGLEILHEFISKLQDEVSFFCVDHEGGRVQRLRGPFFHLPSAQKLQELFQKSGRQDYLYELYRLSATQLSQAGVALNFAPVVDLKTDSTNKSIGDRSFSSEMMDVIQHTKIFCEAYESASVATTIKHFPGLGSSRFDSHEKIAVLEKTEEEMKAKDILAFEEVSIFASGVMTAHCAFPEDPERVLSLDKNFIQNARKKMPTHLFWITDDIGTMKSVSDKNPAQKALEIGYDYILTCDRLEHSYETIEKTILSVENSQPSFAETQELELRCRHARERFERKTIESSVSIWGKSILGLSNEIESVLEKLN